MKQISIKALFFALFVLMIHSAFAKTNDYSKYVLDQSMRLKSEISLKKALSVFLSAEDLEDAYIVCKVGTEKFPTKLFWWNNLIKLSLWTGRTKKATLAFLKSYRISKRKGFKTDVDNLLHLSLTLHRFDIAKELMKQYIKSGKTPSLDKLIYIYENAGAPFELMHILQARYNKTHSKKALISLLRLYQEYGKVKEALELLRNLKSLDVKEALIYANLLYIEKQYNQSLYILKKTIPKTKETNTLFWETLSDLAWTMQNYTLSKRASYILYKANKARTVDYIRLYRFYFYKNKNKKLAMKFALDGWQKSKDLSILSFIINSAYSSKRWGTITNIVNSINDIEMNKLKQKPYIFYIYLLSLIKTGHFKKAKDILENFIGKNTLTSYQIISISKAFMLAGRWKDGNHILSLWAKKHNDIQILEYISYLCQKSGNKQEFKRANKRIIDILEKRSVLQTNKIEPLYSYAKALKNLKDSKAKAVFEKILKLKHIPLDVYLEYMDLLPKRKWLSFIKLLDKKTTKKSDRANLAFKKAEYMAYKGRYKKAVENILPYENVLQNRLYASYFHNIANEWHRAKKLIETIIDNPYYTPYERRLANYQIMDIDRFWQKNLTINERFINSKTYGKNIHQIYFKVKSPYKQWGFIKLKTCALYNNNINQNYKIDGKYQISLGIHKIENLGDKWSLSLLYTDNKPGIKLTAGEDRENYHLFLKAYFNDVEKEETSLLSIFSIKSGLEAEGYYKPTKKIIAGMKFRYNSYNLPSNKKFIKTLASSEYAHIGYILSLEPYLIYIQQDESPTLQHGFGFLYEKGQQDNKLLSKLSLPAMIPNYFYMPYYSIGNIYFWGKNKNIIQDGITLGYMWGKNYKGVAFNPYLNVRYNILKPLDILGYAEYRIDTVSKSGEFRVKLGLEWRF